MNIASSAADTPSASLTYEPFYGLREKPFSLSSDPRFLYTGPSHVPAFERLLAGIRRREGLIVLSGEIGTGKTTLCRGVLNALDRRTFTTFVRDPFLSREDLLKTLLLDFGVMSIQDLKSGRLSGATRPDLSYPLYEFLDSLVPLQAFAVVIIDEAQNLSLSLLEEIRILSELEAREKLLQVVLVGQPELRDNLKLPQLRQVDQRVSVRCELGPLPQEEVPLYIAHRLRVASAGEPAVEFTPEAARLVWRASGGLPRVINLIGDRALHHGHAARATGIDAAIVFAAVAELGRTCDEPPAAAAAQPEPGRAAQPEPGRAAQPEPGGAAQPEPGRAVQPAASMSVQEAAVPVVRALPAREVTARIAEPSHDRHVATPESGGLAFGELADPLAEFSQEADLVGPRSPVRRRMGAIAVGGAALVAIAMAGGWYGFGSERPQAIAPAESRLPAAPTRDGTRQPSEDALPAARAGGSGGETPPSEADAGERPLDAEGSGPAPAAEQGAYAIQVASFQSRARARRLLEELSAAGFLAEEVEADLGARGVWRQVLVGRYATVAEAETDLASIRERPAYADARIVELTGE